MIEAGNGTDGLPLTVGQSEQVGDLFLASGVVHVLDWNSDGKNELVDSGGDVFTYGFEGSLPNGTPIVDRGLRWGQMSRAPHREEQTDVGLCGRVITSGDFNGDHKVEVILAPRGYSKTPTVVFSLKDGAPRQRSQGLPLKIIGPTLAQGTDPTATWGKALMTAMDWDGDGRLDLVAADQDNRGYQPIDPVTGRVPEDARERYTRSGIWKGKEPVWSLHLLRNTGAAGRLEFSYEGLIELPGKLPGGPLCAVDLEDPKAGLLILGYYGDLWHLPLLEPGRKPKWGRLEELCSLQGAPFTRNANMTSLAVGSLDHSKQYDIFAGDISSNVYWCRYYGKDRSGRPIYDTPKKIKQRDPHVNGGKFSVLTLGDWRGTGTPDLLVGSLEGYIFWYKTLSTKPLHFAPPERVRLGDQEIRRVAKPNPAAGYHWGSSQGPSDGFNGGYSNPVLADWDGDGLLDLLVGDMIGLYDWYPNRGTRNQPKLSYPFRLRVNGEPLYGPWRVQPGVADFTGDGLPELIAMDLDLDLALYRRLGHQDHSALLPGEKLRYRDGATIKTHGVYTPGGGDGRGRTKIQVVDWNRDGKWDLLLGVGPQPGSAFLGSYVMISLNVGTNAQPSFRRPVPLLFDPRGAPLQFWRHAAHPAAVDWDGDGQWELLVGADQGFVWYFKPKHFGTSAVPGALAPARRPDGPHEKPTLLGSGCF
jgi:hypothetical protein